MVAVKHQSLANPRAFIKSIYDELKLSGSDEAVAAKKALDIIPEKFKKVLSNANYREQIVDFGTTNIETLKPGTLVYFDCMVQDPNFSKELQMYALELTNNETGKKTIDFTLYADQTEDINHEYSVSHDINPSFIVDTEVIYCTEIPGKTSWNSQRNSIIPEEGSKFEESEEFKNKKKSRYPFPNTKHNAAVFYNGYPNFKVNQSIHVVGIFDYTLCHSEESNEILWPTILAINSSPMNELFTPKEIESKNYSSAKELCHRYLMNHVGNDSLVATYLMLLLISKSNSTNEKAGKFSISLINAPQISDDLLADFSKNPTETFGIGNLSVHHLSTQSLIKVFESIMPVVVSIPVSIPILNKCPWLPNAENEAGLRSGILQLCPHSLVVLDESTLDEGVLEEQGLRNLNSLQRIVTEQKLGFIYPYQQIEIDLDIRFLVISKGKSLIKTDIVIPLTEFSDTADSSEDSVIIESRDLEFIRVYLNKASTLEFTIPSEVSTTISEEYANSRKESKDSPSTLLKTQEDLFLTLTVARLLSLSKMESELTIDSWKESLELEKQRRSRLK
ncbi:Mini-chromosome maintenance complex-binding protein [Smittium culicis]|uniref:Mini-chromosome maintenance complex-binding protein n=1 Tax=Smittium culicis TaxID=133412 RepID=A0A1R1XDV5_9FUNG|nr:Mini-chromosome maintenance complex-binding protein [Smittium culicis]